MGSGSLVSDAAETETEYTPLGRQGGREGEREREREREREVHDRKYHTLLSISWDTDLQIEGQTTNRQTDIQYSANSTNGHVLYINLTVVLLHRESYPAGW